MSTLTSLLVRDQIVSVRKIEEAIQRQVISGGELDTVLLEMEVAPENVIASYRAAAHGLLSASRDEMMIASDAARSAVPKSVVERYHLVPIAADADQIVVAALAPLAAEDHH